MCGVAIFLGWRDGVCGVCGVAGEICARGEFPGGRGAPRGRGGARGGNCAPPGGPGGPKFPRISPEIPPEIPNFGTPAGPPPSKSLIQIPPPHFLLTKKYIY